MFGRSRNIVEKLVQHVPSTGLLRVRSHLYLDSVDAIDAVEEEDEDEDKRDLPIVAVVSWRLHR